jgi:FAD/FMN-containing dehydrogenase/Fe-S oxidoreductase
MSDFTELQRSALEQHLRRHIEGEVRFDPTSRLLYSTDASIYQIQPLGVVIPRSVEDLHTAVQIAVDSHVSIVPRGGGTSLSGQSIGPGIVLDCSKYLNAILDVDPAAKVARVQPGVVLDQLNRALAPHELQFGPDVATANRANLAGMIGNNSAGARSIVYGKTVDHVRRVKVILSDGSRADFGPVDSVEWDHRALVRSLEGSIYRTVRQVVREEAEEIRRRFPQILRRVSGYNLDAFLPHAEKTNGKAVPTAGLVPLIVGSEGTLAFITEAEVGLVARPKARGLLLPHFTSMTAAMDAVAACLEARPSAVELMDQMLLDLARGNLALREAMAPLQGRPAALLMVEFAGDDEAEIADRVARLERRLAGVDGLIAAVPALEPAVRDPLWNLRSGAMPLLYGKPGDRKPVTFVEDAAVTPARLPEFAARFRDLLRRHGTDGAFYGHASVGCLHIRPLLNLKDPSDVARMRRISEAVTDLVLEFGGSLSGEHGDGLARSEWNRKMFGDTVYDAFVRIKKACDPNGLFNPGKVVGAPPMTENLRYPPKYAPAEPPAEFDFSRQEGFIRAVETCNGAGACRKLRGGTMCPSFQATKDEKDSTRGRANALRHALAGDGTGRGAGFRPLRSKWLFDVLDLCLMCKACKAECPSNVDMAKLKAEFLHFYYAGRPRPLGQVLMAHVHRMNRLGAVAAPLFNWFQERGVVRWLLQKAAGIDYRRSLPRLHRNHFRRWFPRHQPAPQAGQVGRVVLLDDCLTTYQEPQIGQAAVRVLEHAGYGVELAGLVCCGRPYISKGYLHDARELIHRQLPRLLRAVNEGRPILGLEPSCLLTLVDEWPDLMPTADVRRVAAAAELAEGWLARQAAAGQCKLELRPRPVRCLVHGHCHQKTLCGVGGTVSALQLIPQVTPIPLDTGCCGMAGSFGFEKEHYDLSVSIANLALLPALRAEPDSLVIAPGTSCRHQIHDLTERRALHPLEVIAEQVGPAVSP